MAKSSTSAALSVIPGSRSAADDDTGLVHAVKHYVTTLVNPLRERLSAQEAEIAALKAACQKDLPLAIDQAGVLVMARADGTMRDLGVVVGERGADGKDGASVEDINALLAPLREQLLSHSADIEALKARPEPAPGRDGLPGIPGRDGAPGKDGADGLGFEDLDVIHDGERGVIFRFMRGEKVRNFPVTMPSMIYREIWKEGVEYQAGDTVTRGGSMWVALKATKAKPDDPNVRDWRMATKHGRDGRDGKSAYQVAVDAGFKGSETEWLKSLRDVKIPTVKVG